MDTKTRFAAIASSALLCLGVLFSPVSIAGEGRVSFVYAGSGWDTGIQGFLTNISLTTGTAQGTFGNSTITITTEWRPAIAADSVTCKAGYPLTFALVYSATVLTMPDQSQLFGIAQSGWICATEGGQYYGQVSGIYAGGAGRFQNATGDFVSKFDGAYLEPNLNFRSIRGSVEGTVGKR